MGLYRTKFYVRAASAAVAVFSAQARAYAGAVVTTENGVTTSETPDYVNFVSAARVPDLSGDNGPRQFCVTDAAYHIDEGRPLREQDVSDSGAGTYEVVLDSHY